MSSQIAKLTGEWSTDVLPTQTTLTHINPAAVTGLVESLLLASSAYPTITKNIDLYLLARNVKGAKASLSVISAQHYIATATATQNFPEMTQIIWNATMELQDLELGFNLYLLELSLSANMIFAVIFAAVLVTHTGLFLWEQYLYFGACFFVGTGLEFAGYVARVMAIGHYLEKGPFLCQIISLTLGPAFIMAGIYYLLAQLLVIYGRQFSRLRPLWFSYVFIFCDVTSLFIQAAGGGLAAIRLQNLESTHTGTKIMISGIAFQVVSMTLFVGLLCEFVWKIYFRANPNVTFLAHRLFALMFQTEHGRRLQQEHLFTSYNPRYSHIWSRRVFGYYPLVILLGVTFIYIRCIYRLIELHEGWTGYLITHEQYVMTLDALQVLLTCLLFIPFHPGVVMGKGARISLSQISDKADEEGSFAEESSLEKPSLSHDELSTIDDEIQRKSIHLDNLLPREVMDPYYVPKIQVQPPTLTLVNESQSPENTYSIRTAASGRTSENFSDGDLGHKFKKWPAFHRASNSRNTSDDIVAVPYDLTTLSPSNSSSPAFYEPSKEKIPKSKQFKKLRELDNKGTPDPINPYTQTIPKKDFAAFGPYELYGIQWADGAEIDVENEREDLDGHDMCGSSFSDDEFLFDFGHPK
ncbi:hypothetical protein HF325_002189 [Metschnikowia pulcherrima]|uniref:Sphingoid long-chain base transporter RSB1 n=1 Tax=Metschnikowia pulcherrima TaxID=27326 RepID=A0A8H7GUU3_9ASCO|nr:hypothetical protein HF325_002189 [Metschnikowia pulcherrima]